MNIRIPSEAMHEKPTSLLYSLEAFSKLEWEKLLKLQNQDGSFLSCPSSTAFAFMQTNDQNCLNYLNKVVQRFNGGGTFRCTIMYFRIIVSRSFNIFLD